MKHGRSKLAESCSCSGGDGLLGRAAIAAASQRRSGKQSRRRKQHLVCVVASSRLRGYVESAKAGLSVFGVDGALGSRVATTSQFLRRMGHTRFGSIPKRSAPSPIRTAQANIQEGTPCAIPKQAGAGSSGDRGSFWRRVRQHRRCPRALRCASAGRARRREGARRRRAIQKN